MKSVLVFLIYSHVWIALAAVAMTWQTQWVLFGRWELSALTGLVFSATLWLYTVHRLVSLRKLPGDATQRRFQIILSYQPWLLVVAGSAVVPVAWFFWQLSAAVKGALLLPVALATGYALPVLPGGRRLRDLPLVKNVLIAGVWTWVTAALPALEHQALYGWSVALLLLGRFCFVGALSLAFDLRDIELDRHMGVRTVPVAIGVGATKRIAIGLNAISMIAVTVQSLLGFYTWFDWLAMGVSVLGSSWLIHRADARKSDLYYAGALDGMMILQFLLVWLLP